MKLVAAGMAQMTRTTAQGSVNGLAPTGVQIPTGLQVSPLDPGNYTIQFSVLPPADGLGFAAYAIINWKAAGHQSVRKISVFSGAVITGVCDSVDVFVVDVSQIGVLGFPPDPSTLVPPGPPIPYQVGISLSRGSRPTSMQPATLVTQLGAITLAPGGGQTFLIPDDSGVISAFIAASRETIGSGAVAPTDIFGVQVSQGFTALNSWYPIIQSPGWVPINGNAIGISIANGGTNPARANVIWGIDG